VAESQQSLCDALQRITQGGSGIQGGPKNSKPLPLSKNCVKSH